MRIIVHEYEGGGLTAYEVSNDGAEYLRELAGSREAGARICAFVDAACDDTEAGVNRLLQTLAWMTAEVEKRKASLVNGVPQPH